MAYEKSLEFLRRCSSKYGFLASISDIANYRRVWARDGVISGISALLSAEKDLIRTFKETLNTLAKYQGKNGQIPSNIDPFIGSVSYGLTTGRIDATLWYIIGCGQYFKYTENKGFLKKHIVSIEKAIEILHAWEFNQKDFIYIPESGDWADEIPRHGYILYDQVLHLQALSDYIVMLKALNRNTDHYQKKYNRLKKKIIVNFWMDNGNTNKKYIYHPEMFSICRRKFKGRQNYWLETFHAHGISKRFDAFANILTILTGISNKEKSNSIFRYISKILGGGYLVPAFYPVITRKNKMKWRKMRSSYSFYFKNKPYHSHNGGLWPMLTGFYIAALVQYGKRERAQLYLDNLNHANSLDKEKRGWGFYEYHHGRKRTPEGTRGMAWSAAGGIMGEQALMGKKIFL